MARCKLLYYVFNFVALANATGYKICYLLTALLTPV